MKITTWLAACTALWAAQATAQTSTMNPSHSMANPARRDFSSRDFGQREFQRSCASCHGSGARGDGVLVPYLRKSPPDLTQLARSNQGVFPFQRLYDAIEGGKLPAHGSRDMPVWGTQYKVEDAEYYSDSALPYDPEALARSRILALLEYLNRIQAR